jgi:hypothetical protein
MDLAPDDSHLVDSYLKHFVTKDQSLDWAFDEFLDVMDADPERAWMLTMALIQRAPDAASISYVAAGPLEDILVKYGTQFIDRIETQSRRDPKFRQALCDVWGVPKQIADRVDKAVGRKS